MSHTGDRATEQIADAAEREHKYVVRVHRRGRADLVVAVAALWWW